MAGGHVWLGDVHGWGTCMAGGCAWLGDVHGCGEACMAGVARVAGHGRALLGGKCMGKGGLCTVWTPPYYTIGKRTVHIILEC